MSTTRSSVCPTETYELFDSQESFKKIAKRLKVSPNTLREWWVDKFGKEAFDARGKKLHASGTVNFGLRHRGSKNKQSVVLEPCSNCGASVGMNLLQKSKTSIVLCSSCSSKKRGVDRDCPVCNLGCVGAKGLSMHLAQATDSGHTGYLKYKQSKVWEGLVSNVDFVTCLICGHKSKTLARHLKSEHKKTAAQYKKQFTEALIRSETLTITRSKAAIKSHLEVSRKGLTKVILCSKCDQEIEVSAFFAYSTHDSRCATCKKIAIELDTSSRWEGLSDPDDYVTCQACGYRATNLIAHVYHKHSELVGRYKSVHPNHELVALKSNVRDKTALRGRTLSAEVKAKMSRSAGWNRGLTKETDERVARAAKAMKGRKIWSTGLTKKDHPSLQVVSDKCSTYRGPKRPWSNRVNLSKVDFTPYVNGTGVVDRKAMSKGLNLSVVTITRYMRVIGLNPMRHNLFSQGLCLSAISEALGYVLYEQEWRSPKFKTVRGDFYRFDGYFPSYNLVVEFHGYQHWTFPSVFIKNVELYCDLQERDRIKENLIHQDPILRYFVVRADEPYTDVNYLRDRLIDEGIFTLGKVPWPGKL